jgi:CRISPR-associated protein (TIGR02584 family)
LKQTNRTLIFTAGGTPQIVTETLYVLLGQMPAWVPSRIVLVTTQAGRRTFEEGISPQGQRIEVLLGENGRLVELFRFFGLDHQYPKIDVVVAQNSEGQPIEDIRTEEEVNAFADMLVALVRKLTSDPPSEIHLSLAGGRKTMTFIAGQILSFFGQPGDVLSHCLVEPPSLEFDRDFWWPGDNGRYDAARVDLHVVPYARMRAHLAVDKTLFKGGSLTYQEVVRRANQALQPLSVVVDIVERKLQIGAELSELTAAQEFAAIALVLIAAKARLPINQRGKGMEKCFALGEDVGAFLRVLACLRLLLDCDAEAKLDNCQPDFSSAISPQKVKNFISRLGSIRDEFETPLSRARKKIDELTMAVAERLYPKSRTTNFLPEEIEIIWPEGIRMEDLIQAN